MAGSYRHATTRTGRLRSNDTMIGMMDNLGDAFEAIEEMYGMIWWLAGGSTEQVEQARQAWRRGIEMSPGRQR